MQHALCRFRGQRIGQQGRGRPGLPAGKAHQVNRRLAGIGLAGNGQPVIAALDQQNDVIALAHHHQVTWHHIAAQHQGIARRVPIAGFVERVAARTAAEIIGRVALAAGQIIIARAAIERRGNVERAAEINPVCAAAAQPGVGIDLRQIPAAAIGECETLNAVIAGARGIGGKEVLDRQPVLAADKSDHQIDRADREEPQIGRGNARAEPDHVGLTRGDIQAVIEDRVLPVTAGEVIGVSAAAAFEQIVANPAGQHIVAAAAFDLVIAAKPVQFRAAGRISGISGNNDVIIAVGRGNCAGQRLDRGGAAIGKLDQADHRIFIGRGRDQRNPVIAARNRQYQIAVAVARSNQIFQRDARAEQQDAFAVRAAIAFDSIMPVAAREAVDIIAAATDQHIVASAAGERFVGSRAGQPVVLIGPGRGGQRAQPGKRDRGAIGEPDAVYPAPCGIVTQNDLVLAVGKGQHQFGARRIALPNGHVADRIAGNLELIGARCIVDHVAAIAAREIERIVACPAADLVIASSAGQHIGAATANYDVVASRLLADNRRLDQIGDLPHSAIAKFDRRHRARTERPLDKQLIAGARESNDQVSRICAGQPDNRIADPVGLQSHRRAGNAAGHFNRIDPVKRGQFNPRTLRQHDPVMSGAGGKGIAGRQLAQVNPVLAFVGQSIADNLAHLRQTKRRAIGEYERFDRIGAIASQHRQGFARAADRDHQIAIDVAEGQQILGNLRAKHDPVDPAGIIHAVVAIADAEAVGIVTQPAFKRIRSGPAGKRIGPVIQPDQTLILGPAGQHPVNHLIDAPAAAVGKFKPLDLRAGQPANDCQDINPATKIEQQVIAIAANNYVVSPYRCAENDAINHARRIAAFDDPVEPVAAREGIGIGAVAAIKRIVALPPIERIGLIEQAFDHVIAAVAGNAQQVFFDELDRERAAIEEPEFLDFKVGSGKLVADQQAVAWPPRNGYQQIVALLGPAQLFKSYPATEFDRVLDRNIGPAPILPTRPYALVLNHIVTIACVELVDIAAITADQQIVTAAPVKRFAKIGTGDRLGRIGPDQVEILRVDVEEIDGAVGKHQLFHRESLHPFADVLVFQHEALAGDPDCDNQIQRGAREVNCAGGDPDKFDPIVASRIEDRIVTLAGPRPVGIVASQTDQPIIARPAIDYIGQFIEAIDRIVAGGLGHIDEVLGKLKR